MQIIERRFTTAVVEVRGADRRMIGGYAAMYNKLSRNLGGFVEMVADVAFNRSRGRDWKGVVARHNHDDNMLLGTTDSGTLRLASDEVGLSWEVNVPESRNDVFEAVTRGDIRGSSFAFRGSEDEWGTTDQGYPLRTLLSVELVDVASVVSPAYPDTTAGLRSLAHHMDADLEEVRKLADDDELRKFFVKTGPKGEPAKTFGPAALIELQAKQDPAA